MTRFYLGLFAGSALCVLVVCNLELRSACGAGLGFAVGTIATVAGLRCQQRALRERSVDVQASLVVAFLAKLALLVVGALVLRFVEPAARVLDYTSFLVAFPIAVLFASTLGALDTLRLLKQARTT